MSTKQMLELLAKRNAKVLVEESIADKYKEEIEQELDEPEDGDKEDEQKIRFNAVYEGYDKIEKEILDLGFSKVGNRKYLNKKDKTQAEVKLNSGNPELVITDKENKQTSIKLRKEILREKE